MKIEQVGRKWRVRRTDMGGYDRHEIMSPLLSKKEAEWFMKQLQEPTPDAVDEWVDIRSEAEAEDKEHEYEGHRPIKREWIRKARAEGRVKPPAKKPPKMTKKRYKQLLERQRQEEENREQEVHLRD